MVAPLLPIEPPPSDPMPKAPIAPAVTLRKTKDPAVKKNSLKPDAAKTKPGVTHIKEEDAKDDPPAPRFIVSATVSAEWPLDADGDNAIAKGASVREMIESKNITGFDRMVEAFIVGGGEEFLELIKQSPESKVVIDEIKHYFALDFKYLHKLTPDEREKVVSEAFDKAKEQASLLARAAGNRLGGVEKMRLVDPGEEGFSFWKWLSAQGDDEAVIKWTSDGKAKFNFRSDLSAGFDSEERGELDLSTAEGAQPDQVGVRLKVLARFSLEKKGKAE